MIFISTSDLMPADWPFLAEHCPDPAIGWDTHSGLPRGVLERRIPRPHLGRWRAAFSAVTAARTCARDGDTPVLLSHLPLMSAATNLARKMRCPEVTQIAFAFNFTDLPQGRRRDYLRRALDGIDEFVVFSRFEQALYTRHLDIPSDRIRFLPWAMDPPEPGPDNPLGPNPDPYLCGIGGEGRDYALLAQAMAGLPQIRMAIVARPYSIEGITFPENVQVFTNLPLAQTWRLAADSAGMVIPLKTDETACGHITLVGAQMLGIPLAITRSRGVADYVGPETAHLIGAGDEADLRGAIEDLAQGGSAVQNRATQARTQALAQNGLNNWLAYLQEAAGRL